MLKLIAIISSLMVITSAFTTIPTILEQASASADTADKSNDINNADEKATSAGASATLSSQLPNVIITSGHQILTSPALYGYRTIISPETIRVHEPTLAKIGDVIQRIPTAVSHQSQTTVHKHAKVITPIVAPAVQTQTHHILRTYNTPLIYSAASPYVNVL